MREQIELDRLREAATALYMAGRWTSEVVPEAEALKLWTELRDALGIRPGTATSEVPGHACDASKL